MLDVQAHADEDSRYSNTLLVSLNNRIYFRDHPFRGAHGNTRCYVDSGPSFRSTVTPITFAQNGPRPHTTPAGDRHKLDTVSRTESIDIEKGAVVGDTSNPNPRYVLLSWYFGRAVQRLELQSFMNEGDSTLNDPNAFEGPTIEGLLFFGVHHGTPDCYCYMALTS